MLDCIVLKFDFKFCIHVYVVVHVWWSDSQNKIFMHNNNSNSNNSQYTFYTCTPVWAKNWLWLQLSAVCTIRDVSCYNCCDFLVCVHSIRNEYYLIARGVHGEQRNQHGHLFLAFLRISFLFASAFCVLFRCPFQCVYSWAASHAAWMDFRFAFLLCGVDLEAYCPIHTHKIHFHGLASLPISILQTK